MIKRKPVLGHRPAQQGLRLLGEVPKHRHFLVLGHRPAQQGLRLIRLKGNTKLHSSTRASSSTTRIETVLPERTQSHRLVLEHRPAQ